MWDKRVFSPPKLWPCHPIFGSVRMQSTQFVPNEGPVSISLNPPQVTHRRAVHRRAIHSAHRLLGPYFSCAWLNKQSIKRQRLLRASLVVRAMDQADSDASRSLDCAEQQTQGRMRCELCSNTIQDAEAAGGIVHMSDSYWHMHCFTCITCGRPVSLEQDDVLLVGSQPMCNECTFNCSDCGNPIVNEVVMCGAYDSCI